MMFLRAMATRMVVGFVAVASLTSGAAQAAGDLLVAPTRIILDGKRGTQVILNNVGAEETTYRISLEIKRMNADGRLDDVDPAVANETEKAALSLVRYAPRRVTLPPNQPQSIRIGLNPADNLPDGEYRVHMLFRAIPKTAPVKEEAAPTGLNIQLTPLYGVTIPVIVRKGSLSATAALANARLTKDEDGAVLEIDATRKGTRSVYGEFRVTKVGESKPILVQKGIGIYPELEKRKIDLPLSEDEAAAIRGKEIIIAYHDTPENGGGLIADLRTVVR